MKEFSSVNDILDFAIRAEQAAVEFYNSLAKDARNEDMRGVFLEFAGEEMKHKARLAGVRESGLLRTENEHIVDLQIADYVVDAEVREGMTYADALIVAMKREKAAFRLYSDLASRTQEAELKQIFLSLALEESRHKLRFELEYDEFVLREN